MYKKVIECLKDMFYTFNEYEKVEFSKRGFAIYNVIGIVKENSQRVYLEFRENGSIWIWSAEGSYQYEIRPNNHYKMIFELGCVLNN